MSEPLRVYVDTSVFGGYFDAEFAGLTVPFFQSVAEGRLRLLLSEALMTELAAAPAQVRELLDEVRRFEEWTPVTAEALALQHAYLEAGVVSAQYANDALHVAVATVARAEALVSWNFRHLVDPRRARGYNGVNIAMGYGLLSVVTPVDLSGLLEAGDDDPTQTA